MTVAGSMVTRRLFLSGRAGAGKLDDPFGVPTLEGLRLVSRKKINGWLVLPDTWVLARGQWWLVKEMGKHWRRRKAHTEDRSSVLFVCASRAV